MRDWRQLKPRRSPLFDLVKGFAFLAILGTGLYLRWGLFFPSSGENPADDLDDPDLVALFVADLGLTFPILLDIESTVSEELYRLLGLPTRGFVGRDGMVRRIDIEALELNTLESKIVSMLVENL